MQTTAQLEARAFRRAAERDKCAGALAALRGPGGGGRSAVDRHRSIFGTIARLFGSSARRAKIATLEVKLAQAESSLKMAVDGLHETHCEDLRHSSWYITALAPIQAALLSAREAYHPWDRALYFGATAYRAINDLTAFDPRLGNSDRNFQELRANTGETIFNFAQAIALLAWKEPSIEIPLLSEKLLRFVSEMASDHETLVLGLLTGIRDADTQIIAAMAEIQSQSADQRAALELAETQLANLNNELVKAAWVKVPGGLRLR